MFLSNDDPAVMNVVIGIIGTEKCHGIFREATFNHNEAKPTCCVISSTSTESCGGKKIKKLAGIFGSYHIS